LLVRDPAEPAVALLEGGALAALELRGDAAVLVPSAGRSRLARVTGCQSAAGRVLFVHAGHRALVVDRAGGAVLADIERADAAALSPDGQTLAVVTYRTVTLWVGDPLRPVRQIDLPGALPGELAFSPDGLILAVATGYGVVLIDLDLK
jgi:hypothetical protein